MWGLSRSAAADAVIASLGAEPVRGELEDLASVRRAASAADAVISAAACSAAEAPAVDALLDLLAGSGRPLSTPPETGVVAQLSNGEPSVDCFAEASAPWTMASAANSTTRWPASANAGPWPRRSPRCGLPAASWRPEEAEVEQGYDRFISRLVVRSNSRTSSGLTEARLGWRAQRRDLIRDIVEGSYRTAWRD